MRKFLKIIQQSKIDLTVKKISEYKSSSSLLNFHRRFREKCGLEFAIAAGNAPYLSDERLIQIIVGVIRFNQIYQQFPEDYPTEIYLKRLRNIKDNNHNNKF